MALTAEQIHQIEAQPAVDAAQDTRLAILEAKVASYAATPAQIASIVQSLATLASQLLAAGGQS